MFKLTKLTQTRQRAKIKACLVNFFKVLARFTKDAHERLSKGH